MNAIETHLTNRTGHYREKIEELRQWDKRFSTIRLLAFLGICLLLYLSAWLFSGWVFAGTLLACAAGFGWIVNRHRRLDRVLQSFEIWHSIQETHLARHRLDWQNIPAKRIMQGEYADHPFARDLNIVGDHSLHQLIDTSIYSESSELLKKWLLAEKADLEEIHKRHTLAKELKQKTHFRDRIRLNAALVRSTENEKDWSMNRLLHWMRNPTGFNYRRPLTALGLLCASNIILLLLWMLELTGPYVIFTFVAYLAVYNFNSEKIETLFDDAFQIEKLLRRFSTVLLYLENYSHKQGSALSDFCAMYHEADSAPSVYLKKIIRLASAATVQRNDVIRLIVNAFFPWDMYFAWRLDAYKTELEPELSRWLGRFYELEALSSIANFAWLNPEYTFSAPSEEKGNSDLPVFEAKGLGHPLIPKERKVTNDFAIGSTGDLILITGSNMAGKSTFLRTVGINLCLCFAGGPVNAFSFRTIPFRLFTSINVKDSLDQGLSHFYAEVRRLRKLLDELNRPDGYPLFFFVDEIFKGTNNRERLIGSTAFLKEVAGRNGVGMISTHDLELANLEEEIPALANRHFEETIKDGKMSFEYKIKAGPCPTTNALKIMEMEGLPT